jgi:hypothetical protein
MSRIAALSKLPGAAGSGVSALGTSLRGSSAYQGVSNTAAKEVSATLNYGQIGMIFTLAMSYLVVASLGIDMFSKCDELKGNTTQENLNKWLIATLAIAITIPFTLVLAKMAGSKLTGIMALLFAVMGIVGSAAVLNWTNNCAANKENESNKVYGGINMAIFILMLLVGVFLLRPKSKVV